tara:strand:- start:824 stop:1429 length:606 start_codon:yes stop_codon:yes gene_type:complete
MSNIQFAEYAPGQVSVLEGHLGGFYTTVDKASHCPEMFKYLIENLDINSVLDIGCGMGYQMQEFMKYCDEVVGVDGSEYATSNSPVKESIFKHDFSVGELETEDRFDLCWCCEFVEHVKEEFRDNFLSSFAFCKYVAMTHAVPGQGGHHHVNCQPMEYWVEHMSRFGFEFDEEMTDQLKELAGKGTHYGNTGLFFRKKIDG